MQLVQHSVGSKNKFFCFFLIDLFINIFIMRSFSLLECLDVCVCVWGGL